MHDLLGRPGTQRGLGAVQAQNLIRRPEKRTSWLCLLGDVAGACVLRVVLVFGQTFVQMQISRNYNFIRSYSSTATAVAVCGETQAEFAVPSAFEMNYATMVIYWLCLRLEARRSWS